MPRKLGPKLILSLTILIVAISGVSAGFPDKRVGFPESANQR